jgi:hypothetical protein
MEMAQTRKQVTMLVTVSVPREMTAAEARLEVRTLVNDQCNYSADEGDVKVRSIKPAKA